MSEEDKRILNRRCRELRTLLMRVKTMCPSEPESADLYKDDPESFKAWGQLVIALTNYLIVVLEEKL